MNKAPLIIAGIAVLAVAAYLVINNKAAAPVEEAAPAPMEAPAPEAAAPAAAAKPADNPYGLKAMIDHGDAVSKGVLALLAGNTPLGISRPNPQPLAYLTNPAYLAQVLQLGFGIPASIAPGIVSNLKPIHRETFANYSENTAYDVYADGTFKLTDKFEITAGIRYTSEDREAAYASSVDNGRSILGILLAVIGLVITFKATTTETADGDKIGKWAWKPLFFILAANFTFGILLGGLPSIGVPAMGLIVGIYALTFIASLAGNEFRAKSVFVLATILAAGSYVAFVWALTLQFPVWPSFISG